MVQFGGVEERTGVELRHASGVAVMQVQAFAPDRADDALGEGILPGRPRGDEDLAHPQAVHPSCEHIVVDGVAIAEQVLGRCPFRKLSTSWWAAQAAVGGR